MFSQIPSRVRKKLVLARKFSFKGSLKNFKGGFSFNVTCAFLLQENNGREFQN